eukprot:scaffold8614_cov65-Isochrysis_galbana.AAC.2
MRQGGAQYRGGSLNTEMCVAVAQSKMGGVPGAAALQRRPGVLAGTVWGASGVRAVGLRVCVHTWKETSSVKRKSDELVPDCEVLWVTDGLSLARRKRA